MKAAQVTGHTVHV